jgi:phage terminase large subunit
VSSILQIDTPRWFIPLLKPARYKGIWGGRGSGKSHAVAEYIIEQSVVGKCDVVCIREVQKSLQQSVKRLLETKIESLGVSSYFEVQHDRILSKHGGTIIFQGMANHTADSIKSLEGFDIAWFEEAQSCSQRSLDLLRPTMRKETSEMIFTWNPRYKDDPIDRLLRGVNPPPAATIVRVNYQDNPWFPSVLKDEMNYDMKRDMEKYQHVWLGEYVKNTESRVFKNWHIDEFEAPEDAVLRFGADWGFAVDHTVLVRCFIVGRTLYIDHEAYMVGCEIPNTPELFMSVPEAEKWPIIADSARPETISYMKNHGFPKILPAVKGPKSLEEGIEWLKSFDIVVHPRCEHAIQELTMYSYKTDPLTGQVLPLLADKDNHVIDAVRYACESARRAQKKTPVDVAPLPMMNRW